MPKLFLKSGFRFFWGKPLRIVLSLLLIVASLIVSGVGLTVKTYDYTEINRQLFYSEAYGEFYKPNKYMNFFKRGFTGSPGALDLGGERLLSVGEVNAFSERLEEIGQGFFISKIPIANSPEDWNVGPYRLFEYFDVEGYDPMVYDPSLYRLTNDEGQIAPFFVYSDDPENYFPNMTEKEKEHYRVSLQATGVRSLYQGLSCYVGDEEDLALYDYTLHGKLPEGMNEIVIPMSVYQSFASYGYIDRETGERAEINSYEDIIGKEIKMYGTHEFGKTKIVGVMEIGYEAENLEFCLYENTLDPSDEKVQNRIAIGAFGEQWIGNGVGPVFSLIVHRSYFDDCIPNSYLTHNYERPGYTSCATVLKWSEPKVRDTYWDIAMEPLRARDIFSLEDTAEEYLGYSGSASVELYYFGQSAVQYEPFVWTAYLSIPFTLILSAYLVYATLYEKRRRLYIMRCLGMSRKRAAVMLMLPVLVFALLAGILALVGTAAILPTMLSEFQIAYWESVYMVTLPGFTLTPLCASYLLLWPIFSGLIGVGISMASYNSTLRRTERRKK